MSETKQDRSLMEPQRWMEMRDERGRLMAKVNPADGLLEVRRDGASAVFDLRDYLTFLSDLARTR